MVILGIYNTPGPAPGSIEGIIYSQVPLKFIICGSPEIFAFALTLSDTAGVLSFPQPVNSKSTAAAIAKADFLIRSSPVNIL